jgi:hypothetical protein
LDFSNRAGVIETLKKRKKGIFKEIPLPDYLLKDLKFYIQDLLILQEKSQELWNFSLRIS